MFKPGNVAGRRIRQESPEIPNQLLLSCRLLPSRRTYPFQLRDWNVRNFSQFKHLTRTTAIRTTPNHDSVNLRIRENNSRLWC